MSSFGRFDRAFRCTTLAALLVTASAVEGWAQTASWKPEKNVEIVVPAAPGGGTDRTARTIQMILQQGRLVEAPIVVVNKPGAGGSLGLLYVTQHSRDGHFLAITQPALLTNNITGLSKLSYGNFTPVVQLSSEYIGFSVRADSGIKGAGEVVEQVKKDPQSVVFGVSNALGAPGHIALALVMRAAGIDVKKLKVVVFASGGESRTALMGGHIDVVPTTVANLVAPIKTGKVRVVAVTAPRRISGVFAQVPTWKEQGIDAVIGNWRGVVGPPGMSRAQVQYWEAAFLKMTSSEDWKKDLERNAAESEFMDSSRSRKFLESQNDELRRILAELELAK
ncbi:MAG: tripartite tricarboxylate transporter substrate binding protein [Betaproteobacteria bacterium]|nr:tripartite tricarboxylate transporter substrate binding protein [Betaproteobacteria bacterium]